MSRVPLTTALALPDLGSDFDKARCSQLAVRPFTQVNGLKRLFVFQRLPNSLKSSWSSGDGALAGSRQ